MATSTRTLPGTIPTIAEEHVEAEMAMRAASDQYAASLALARFQSLTDPALQCGHGVSLYDSCRPCGAAVGE